MSEETTVFEKYSKRLCERLYSCIQENKGIEVCLNQGSQNFENWIQITAGAFFEELNPKSVVIEHPRGNVDLLIELEEKEIAIAIKVVRLGTKFGDGVKIAKIRDDIDKLRNSYENAEKVLMCVVYRYKESEKSWGLLKGRNATVDYCNELGTVSRLIGKEPIEVGNKKLLLDLFLIK